MEKAPKTPAETKAEKEKAEKAAAASKEFKPRAAKGARNTPEKQQLR
jgi:hypothetical protein